MPSSRGVLVFAAGIGLWVAARLAGSPVLHMVAAGIVVLPFAAALFARWSRQRLVIRRRLSETHVAPGQRLSVEVEVENQSPSSTSFLLIEDHATPPTAGRPARLVLTGLPAHGKQRASYTLVPQVRGRHLLGPMTLDVADPFALTRMRAEFGKRDELIVTPEVELLDGSAASPFGTTSAVSLSRQLFRTGEEFYTMRQYQLGDDLRRIHWPSVARSGQLMIRQDESSRRSSALLFLDTRSAALGRSHGPAFEKAVSATASIGVLLARYAYSLRLATSQLPPTPLTEEQLLETLAGVNHDGSLSLAPALTRLRGASSSDMTLVAVTAPPEPKELTPLIRVGSVFGPRIAVLIYPVDPASLPPDRQSHLEGRASVARLSLSRSGWDVLVLPPNGKLRDVWHPSKSALPAFSGSSR